MGSVHLYIFSMFWLKVNINSLVDVVRKYIALAEERTEAARQESHQTVLDIDDLDLPDSPERSGYSTVAVISYFRNNNPMPLVVLAICCCLGDYHVSDHKRADMKVQAPHTSSLYWCCTLYLGNNHCTNKNFMLFCSLDFNVICYSCKSLPF